MSEFQTFQYNSFPLECVCVDGEPWFRATHVATILGYPDTMEAISGFDDDDAKTLRELIPDLTPQCMDDFYERRANFLSAYGVSCLVYKSNTQDADKFKRWI